MRASYDESCKVGNGRRMISITQQQLARWNASLRERALEAEFSVTGVLRELRSLGFHSCMYYDAAPNAASQDYQIVLSAVEGSIGTDCIGSRIDYKQSAIGMIPRSSQPVVQEAQDSNHSRQSVELAKRLGILDKHRIHVPLIYRGELTGALTCVWTGAPDVVDSEVIAGLENLAAMLTKYWAIATDRMIAKLVAELKESRAPTDAAALKDLLQHAMRLTRLAIKGSAAALFDYDWYTGVVSKELEDIPDYRGVTPIEEKYSVGKFLTGLAWNDPKVRHIVDFDGYRRVFEQEVASPSVHFHSRVIGDVTTLLYSRIGDEDGGYLLRLTNRNDSHNLPFFNSHRVILNKISGELGQMVDELIQMRKLRGLQTVAYTAVQNITDPKHTFDATVKQLSYECVPNLTAVALDACAEYVSNVLTTSPGIERGLMGPVDATSNPILTKALTGVDVQFHAIGTKYNKDNYLNPFRENGVNHIITVPFGAHALKGFLMVACPSSKGALADLRRRIPPKHLESLKAYSALIASCIDSEESHVTSENAKRLIGMIGHEVQGPVARLGQQAIASLIDTVELLATLPAKYPSENITTTGQQILKTQEDLGRQMQQIGVLMDVAVDMAQETKGVLQVHFAEYDLLDILEAAREEVKSTTEAVDAFDRPMLFDFKFNDACKKLPTMVGDRDLILKVFVNLFRNAVKYSLPRWKGEGVQVDVYGQPQKGQSIIQVRNWGIAIPEGMREKIFRPFVRGDIKDRLKARRGMGLGLYVARRFVSAHKGRVYCPQSDATLDDPKRRDVEGWDTTFEVRLPTNLPLGTFDDESQ